MRGEAHGPKSHTLSDVQYRRRRIVLSSHATKRALGGSETVRSNRRASRGRDRSAASSHGPLDRGGNYPVAMAVRDLDDVVAAQCRGRRVSLILAGHDSEPGWMAEVAVAENVAPGAVMSGTRFASTA